MRERTRILIDARELIADKSLWTQGSMESTDDPPRRCLSGAICAATGTLEHEISENPVTADVLALVSMTIQKQPEAQGKLDKFMTAEDIEHFEAEDSDWLAAFNDYSAHAEVIGLLNEAIARSEGSCFQCCDLLKPERFHIVSMANGIEQVLCAQCSLRPEHHPHADGEAERFNLYHPPQIDAHNFFEACQRWSDETRELVFDAIKSHPKSRDYLCLQQIPDGRDLSHYTEVEHTAYRQGLVDASTIEDWMIAFANYDQDELIKLLSSIEASPETKKNLEPATIAFCGHLGGRFIHDEAANAHLN